MHPLQRQLETHWSIEEEDPNNPVPATKECEESIKWWLQRGAL